MRIRVRPQLSFRGALALCLVGVVGIAGPLVPAAAGKALGRTSGACTLVSASAVQTILGTSREFVSPPVVVTDGSDVCSWHSTQPNCFLRSFSIKVWSRPADVRRIETDSAATTAFARAWDLGRGSFFESDNLPAGSAIVIDHLFVARDRVWVEFTLAGRLDSGGSHGLLGAAARSVVSTR